MEDHKELMLRLVQRIEITYKVQKTKKHYAVGIGKDGAVQYSTPSVSFREARISSLDAERLIQEQAGKLFLAEATPVGDSHLWSIRFYSRKGLLYALDGWGKDDPMRFLIIEELLGELEKLIRVDLGAFPVQKKQAKEAEERRIRELSQAAKEHGAARLIPAQSAMLGFSQRLLKQAAGHGQGNTLLSPVSAAVMLDLLSEGSDGNSREEILRYWGVENSILREGIRDRIHSLMQGRSVCAANALYADRATIPFVPAAFAERMFKTAATDILTDDSDPASTINGWASQKTNGMIPKLLQDGSYVDNLSVLNAIAFESAWFTPYEDDDIESGIFFRLDGGVDRADYLCSTEDSLIISDHAIGFAKAYEDTDFSFFSLLPRETNDPLAFLAGLPENGLAELLCSAISMDVVVKLPEFSFDWSDSLKSIMEAAGVNDIFHPDTADLRHLLTIPGSCISDITHHTHIEVDRNGTKAAAITMGACVAGCLPENLPVEVILDRPFLFGIIHRETKLPLFLGIVNSIDG